MSVSMHKSKPGVPLVLSDYLTGDLEWLDRIGRGVRDSTKRPIRVGTGGQALSALACVR